MQSKLHDAFLIERFMKNLSCPNDKAGRILSITRHMKKLLLLIQHVNIKDINFFSFSNE